MLPFLNLVVVVTLSLHLSHMQYLIFLFLGNFKELNCSFTVYSVLEMFWTPLAIIWYTIIVCLCNTLLCTPYSVIIIIIFVCPAASQPAPYAIDNAYWSKMPKLINVTKDRSSLGITLVTREVSTLGLWSPSLVVCLYPAAGMYCANLISVWVGWQETITSVYTF